MKFRTMPLLTTLLFALSIGLSPYIFAANPVWDSNYVYNKEAWDATSTGGLKKGIRQSKEHKRSSKSKGSMRFALIPNKCIRNPTKDGLDDDCDRGIRRSQLRSHTSYKRNENLEFRFSIKKPYRKSKGLTKITHPLDKYFMNIYEIKPKNAVPIISLLLDPVSNKILLRQSLVNHGVAGVVKPNDINTVVGKLKSDWNDFKVETKLSTNTKGYVKVYQNNKLIYSYKGKTAYPYKNDTRHWIGSYVCCGFGDLLHKKEPTHLFYYDMVSGQQLAPSGTDQSAANQQSFSIDSGRVATVEVARSRLDGEPNSWAMNEVRGVKISGDDIDTPLRFDRVRVMVGFSDPNELVLSIFKSDFPSIKDSSVCGNKWLDKSSRSRPEWRFEFLLDETSISNNCRFQMLTKEEQDKLWLLVNNIDRIVESADTPAPKGTSPNYWLELAAKIRAVAPDSFYR